MGGYQMCAENVNSHKCQRHYEVPPGSVFSNKVQLLQMDCSLFKMKKRKQLKKERKEEKNKVQLLQMYCSIRSLQ